MNNSNIRVPYGQSVHGQEEIDAVVKVLEHSTQMGEAVEQMQQQVASLFDKQFGIMVNSGTSALYLAIEILQLPAGSEIITPVLSFATTVGAIVKNGCVPAFVDVELDTYNSDITKIEALITPKTKALLIPNLLGNLPDWQQLRAIANKHQLILIEDCADTLGALYDGQSTGTYSDISITSFYGNHLINCAGNGGMLCVNDKALAEQAKLLRSWGRAASLETNAETIESRFTNAEIDNINYDKKFIFSAIGYNLEPAELGAAFGLVQLKKLPSFIELRQKYFLQHLDFFKAFDDYFILPRQLSLANTAWMNFPLQCKESAPFTRQQLQIHLEKHNIQTRTVFTGNILRQPGFKAIEHHSAKEGYPNADLITKNGLLIGCHHGLTIEQISHLYSITEQFIQEKT